MAMGQTSTITVFLGTSEELAEDQILMGDFFGELNRLTLSRGVYFRLIKWQWDGRNDPLRDYDALVRESSLCLFLFLTSGGTEMERRFDAALKAFRSQGAPQIITWFKRVPRGGAVTPELDAFRQRLDQQLHHFYNTYETLDSVKLGMLLQVARTLDVPTGGSGPLAGSSPAMAVAPLAAEMPAPFAVPLMGAVSAKDDSIMGLEIREDMACLWGTPLVSLADVPSYAGWQRIHVERSELDALEPRYQSFLARTLRDPQDRMARDELRSLSLRREELSRSVERGQRLFLEFMLEMSRRTSAGAPLLTERQRQAYRLVDQGLIAEAIELLDADDIRRDRDLAEREMLIAEAGRKVAAERLRSHVAEQLQLAELLLSRPSGESVAQAYDLFRDAAECERRHGLGYRAQMSCGCHLAGLFRLTEAREHLLSAERQLESLAHGCDDEIANDYTLLLETLIDLGLNLNDASLARRAAECEVEFLRRDRPNWNLALVSALRGQGIALERLGESTSALRALNKALALLPGKMEGYPTYVVREMALTMYALCEFTFRQGDFERAERSSATARSLCFAIIRRVDSTEEDVIRYIGATISRACMLAMVNGDFERSIDLLKDSARRLRLLVEKGREPRRLSLFAQTLHLLSQSFLAIDDCVCAGVTARECLGISRELYELEPRAFAVQYGMALICMASCHLISDRYDDAEVPLKESVALLDGFPEETPDARGMTRCFALSLLSTCLKEQGDQEGALACARRAWDEYESLLDIAPGAVEHSFVTTLLELAEIAPSDDEAIKAARRAVGISRAAANAGRVLMVEQLANSLFILGKRHFRRGDDCAADELEEALNIYERLLESGLPGLAGSYSACADRLAKLYRVAKDWEGVIRVRSRELGAAERFGEGFQGWWMRRARWEIGVAQRELGQLEEATRTFLEVTDACSEAGEIKNLFGGLRLLGQVYERRGLRKDAVEAFQSALGVYRAHATDFDERDMRALEGDFARVHVLESSEEG